MNCLFQPPLWITVLTLGGQCVFAEEAQVARRVLHLEGLWQIAEGRMDQVPAAFDRTVPVPGLVSLAQPAFVEPGPKVADRQGASQKDPRRDAFWYRRTFQLAAPVPAVAILKVHKAMFGTRVFLNAQLLGEHETTSTETDPAIRQVRGLDLSNRPWDNSYTYPQEPGDVFEAHPYHFYDPTYRLSKLAGTDLLPQGNSLHNDSKHAVIINEYGWLWLNRDGTPTTLSSARFSRLDHKRRGRTLQGRLAAVSLILTRRRGPTIRNMGYANIRIHLRKMRTSI